MSITLHIPDSVTSGLRRSEGEMEPRLRTELAIALYAQGILSFGKGSELAGVSRQQFSGLIAQREIPRHYGTEELAEDVGMRVVSNTSPLSNLAIIGRIALLKEQFAGIVEPEAVSLELGNLQHAGGREQLDLA